MHHQNYYECADPLPNSLPLEAKCHICLLEIVKENNVELAKSVSAFYLHKFPML